MTEFKHQATLDLITGCGWLQTLLCKQGVWEREPVLQPNSTRQTPGWLSETRKADLTTPGSTPANL